MATVPSASGDTMRDTIEQAGHNLKVAQKHLMNALVSASAEPLDWAQAVGAALVRLQEAETAVNEAYRIVELNRRRS